MQSYIKSPKQIALRFGQIVRRIRKEGGWSQDEVAEKAQIRESAVVDIENGLYKTDIYEVLSLAFALQKPVHRLMPSLVGYKQEGTDNGERISASS